MTQSIPTHFGVLDAAQVKGVHEETVRRAIRGGRLPALRVGGRFVLRAADLESWQPAYDKAPRSRVAGQGRDSRRGPVAASAPENGKRAEASPERHNLPVPLSSFVGRERAVAEVGRLLETVRLLTLTGAGGVGKTRLAIEVAAEQVDRFADGVCFVDLAALADASLVPQAVAGASGVRALPRRPLVEALVEALRPKRLLLLLDNCEHLAAACADLAHALLGDCPGLRILATSREALGVPGETTWLVPSLSLPALTLGFTQDSRRAPAPELIAEFEAVRLFVERATAASRDFAMTEANAEAVARICRQLDGIPLALELAAAWAKVLSMEEVAARLVTGSGLLAAGGRAAMPRHRTMAAAIDASYRLLAEPERRLFERLSVFAGGWTLAAAEALAASEAEDAGASAAGLRGPEADVALGLLARLVDKSLVTVEPDADGGVRYRLLEPLRQFAQERLEATGAAAAARDRHASYFLGLAEGAQAGLWGAAGAAGAWVPRLARENDNLRAALRWLIDRGDLERAERLGAALPRFWVFSGQVKEGRARLAELLAWPAGRPATRERARLHVGAAAAALYDLDTDACRALGEEGLALAREVDDNWAVAYALFLLVTADVGESRGVPPAAARERLGEGIAASRAAGDRVLEAMHLLTLCLVALAGGDETRAEAAATEALAIAEEVGAVRETARALGCLGAIAYRRGRLPSARDLLERSRSAWRHGGERIEEGILLHSLALLATDQGDFQGAQAFIAAMIEIWSAIGRPVLLACAILQDFAYLAAARGEHALALRVAGALDAAGFPPGVPRPYYGGGAPDRRLGLARETLGEPAAAIAWEEGRRTSVAEAMELVTQALAELAGPERSARPRARPVRPPGPLTPREREVAELVARGLVNRRIAETLVIAEATVERHLSNIFGRLGLSSRAELAVWATTHPRPAAR